MLIVWYNIVVFNRIECYGMLLKVRNGIGAKFGDFQVTDDVSPKAIHLFFI